MKFFAPAPDIPERALIDAAIAEGRVTTCPPMTFSPPEVPKFAGWTLNRNRMELAQLRRTKVLKLLRDGMNRKEISEKLSMGKEAVRDAIKALRAQGCKWD